MHGIGQQQSGGNQMLPNWEAALRDGVEPARGRGGPTPLLDLPYYGARSPAYADGTEGSRGPDAPEDLHGDLVLQP